MEMMDLFADDDDEEPAPTPPKEGRGELQDLDYVPLDVCTDATDITSIEALEELAELNPDLLLPYILPLNKKFTETRDTVHDIFNREGLQFVHVQMPNALPALKREHETVGTHDAPGVSRKVYQSSKLECLPSGKLGKLRVHKSGKIKLHIDGHEFNFTKGNGSTCKQQVCCHLEQNNEFLFLGNFHNRFVVSPDLADLLSNGHT